MEWTREDDRETDSGNGVVTLVAEDVDVGKAERGRIIAVKPTAASKAATKVRRMTFPKSKHVLI